MVFPKNMEGLHAYRDFCKIILLLKWINSPNFQSLNSPVPPTLMSTSAVTSQVQARWRAEVTQSHKSTPPLVQETASQYHFQFFPVCNFIEN